MPKPIAAVAAVMFFVALPAMADDTASCVDASSRAQTLRDAHKLIDAREQLRVCGQASCPAAVRRDCTGWLEAVDRALPTVVPSLKDGDGKDVVDAAVTVDGKPFAASLTGTSLPVDPGLHAFHFQRADGTTADQQVLVAEGQRDVVISARVLVAAHSPPSPSPPPAPAASPTWTIVGWTAGGVGLAGLLLGSVAGGLAVADKGSASCNASGKCADFGEVGSARTAAHVSDAGFIAGGVLVGAGGAILLFAPRRRTSDGAWVGVQPSAAAGGAGLWLRGGW
jgi:hypothetical protein